MRFIVYPTNSRSNLKFVFEATMKHADEECSLLLVQIRKLIVIKQQLQVTNLGCKSRKSQIGDFAMANKKSTARSERSANYLSSSNEPAFQRKTWQQS